MTSGTSTKLTYEDYATFPDDGRRHEIIDGEHYVSPSPGTKHQKIVRRLVVALGSYLAENHVGELFSAPLDVVLSPVDVVQPDLLYVSGKRSAIITEKAVQGPPDLVIEILSESTRRTDVIVKRKLYEHFGVQEYWIVDPVIDSIEILRRGATALERATELRAETGGELDSPLFPGFTMAVVEVFRD